MQSGEVQLAEILRSSSAPKIRIDEFLSEAHADFLSARGEWVKALESYRMITHEYQKYRGPTSDYFNFNLILTYLDLDYFLGAADLGEAENVLRQNMEAGASRSICLWLLAILFSRQGRFADARKQLAEAVNSAGQPISETTLLYAEAELDLSEGHWEEAVSKEQTLIDRFRHSGYRWGVARSLISLGDALLGRDAPGDRERAQEAYQQSLEMFTEMGATGYIQVLEERLGRMLK